MGSVLEDFKGLFTTARRSARSGSRDAEATEERERRRAATADCRVFVGTEAYKEYRKALEKELLNDDVDPGAGIEVAAGATFRRAGIRRAIGLLDHMVVLAQENVDA